uniref:Uncharacterized protein n=1 Tax=Aegilops tauschii subsp. strangulata TaxID=200361 RepID=A0A453SMS0_AEGTS
HFEPISSQAHLFASQTPRGARPFYSRGGAWRGGDRRRERRGIPTLLGREARRLLLRLALAGGAAALDPGLPSPSWVKSKGVPKASVMIENR